MSRFSKISWLVILLILLVVLVDYLIPMHPINRWLYGKENGDPNIGAVIVTTADETKTIWLPDSTRIDLLPHSSIRAIPMNYPGIVAGPN
jgi:hypothetical protein